MKRFARALGASALAAALLVAGVGFAAPAADPAASAWFETDQAGLGAATARTAQAVAEGNRAYEAKFGFLYLVCAAGRSADELLGTLEARLTRTRAEEMRTAAEEQAKILRLRIRRWLEG